MRVRVHCRHISALDSVRLVPGISCRCVLPFQIKVIGLKNNCEKEQARDENTISEEIITVLTRYRPIVLELI